MDKDRVKGGMNDAAGRVKRQIGEWTGDKDAQAEGALQQMKGKVQKAIGAMKDAARTARNDVERERMREDKLTTEQERELEQHTGHGNH